MQPVLLALAGLLGLQASPAPPGPHSAHATVQPVARIRTEAPANAFVLRATVSLPASTVPPFARGSSPYRILDTDGTPLTTQWELVARTATRRLIELSARIPSGTPGPRVFDVVAEESPYHYADFLPVPLALARQPGRVVLEVEDATGTVHRSSLSGRATSFHRGGPVSVTGAHHLTTPVGGFHVWFTIDALSRSVGLILNWHAGALPARPDVFFRSARLVLPPGWTWTPVLPDPVQDPGAGWLVSPGAHVLPQRMERSFRLVLHPATHPPDVSGRGFGVSDWGEGGYLAQEVALPDLSHVAIDLAPRRRDDYDRLARWVATLSGDQPVSPLWPAAGVRYGGMTGGVDIEQLPAVPLAVAGDPDGLLSLYVDQLRYASRQMGCIYEPDGRPLVLDDHLEPDGSAAWDMYNNLFLGNPPKDAPFRFSGTGPGVGTAAYDPLDFAPIDLQHYVRRTKSNKALVWLANDPLALLYLRMDAELGRMTFFEGPGGRLTVPAVPGLGTEMGRAEAWVADCMAHAWAVSDDAWRRRSAAWFATFVDALRAARLPSGLFSARDTGKTAVDPPYGDGKTADYWVHRSNEQIFLVHALRAIEASVGLDPSDLIRGAAGGLWRFAWKVGTRGPLERYAAGPIAGPRYALRAEVPPGLTDSVGADSYHVGTLIGHGHVAGEPLFGALLAYTGTSSLTAARAQLEARGLRDIQEWANTLAVLQDLLDGP